jgi:hypothetical protein
MLLQTLRDTHIQYKNKQDTFEEPVPLKFSSFLLHYLYFVEMEGYCTKGVREIGWLIGSQGFSRSGSD